MRPGGRPEEGEIPVVISGDGLMGQVGGALAETGAAWGSSPAAAATTSRGSWASPTRSRRLGRRARWRPRARDRRRRGNGRRFLCIACCGFDSEANRIANEAKLIRGKLVYAYAALRALARLEARAFTVDLDGGGREFAGYSVAVANSRAYGGGMFVAPDAELDDGLLDVVTVSDVGKLRYLGNLPKVFKGEHVEQRGGHELRGADGRDQCRPELRRIRRWRAPHGPAGDPAHADPRAQGDCAAAARLAWPRR